MSWTSNGRPSVQRDWRKTDLRQGKIRPQEIRMRRSREKGAMPDLSEGPEAMLLVPPHEEEEETCRRKSPHAPIGSDSLPALREGGEG